MEVLGERLKDLRIENGYKQEELANLLNITTSAYGYYEQGRNEPSLESLKIIADFYHISSDYLLGRINTPNHPVHFPLAENLQLTEMELQAIRKMKSLFLEEISQKPDENVERLYRLWEFIKKELES